MITPTRFYESPNCEDLVVHFRIENTQKAYRLGFLSLLWGYGCVQSMIWLCTALISSRLIYLISSHLISSHLISYHIISYHIKSYHIILCYIYYIYCIFALYLLDLHSVHQFINKQPSKIADHTYINALMDLRSVVVAVVCAVSSTGFGG